ncbi:MAG: COX15/CtaA family protein [archaeon]|nr:MAG: COX15/CtaA family protein [archaeon]
MDFKRIALFASVVALLLQLMVGAYVTAAGFGGACGTDLPRDWPTCLGGLLPPAQLGPVAEYTHRILALLSTFLLLASAAIYWRGSFGGDPARKLLLASIALIFGEILLGGLVVSRELQPSLVALHQGVAVVIFGLVVAALAKSRPKQQGST